MHLFTFSILCYDIHYSDTPNLMCVCSFQDSYLSDSEHREWNRPSRWRTGSSQNLYSLLLLPRDTVCRCLCRNVDRCRRAGGHLRRSPRVLSPDSLTGFCAEPWPCERHTRNAVISPSCGQLRERMFANASLVTQMYRFYICPHQLAKYGTCLQQQFHNQISILQRGPEVRMSLTHPRCRGWAKPRWQLQWGVCSSAEGWADRRWAVSDTPAPPLDSYLHLSLKCCCIIITDYI